MTLLVVRGGALGDFVLTVPTLQALRLRADRLLLACNPRFAALWPDLGDEVIDLDQASWIFGAGAPPEPLDAAVAWSRGAADALVGLGLPAVRAGAPRPPDGVHASDHLWRTAGLAGDSPAPRVRPDAAVASVLPDPLGEAVVVLAPGAGAPNKRWPGMAALAERLADRGVAFAWLPGRDEGLAGIRAPSETGGTVLPPLDLPELVALAARCRAWIGNDTGTTHLAAAAGAPVFALFGPTDPRCWAPRAPPGGVVEVLDFTTSPTTLAARLDGD